MDSMERATSASATATSAAARLASAAPPHYETIYEASIEPRSEKSRRSEPRGTSVGGGLGSRQLRGSDRRLESRARCLGQPPRARIEGSVPGAAAEGSNRGLGAWGSHRGLESRARCSNCSCLLIKGCLMESHTSI